MKLPSKGGKGGWVAKFTYLEGLGGGAHDGAVVGAHGEGGQHVSRQRIGALPRLQQVLADLVHLGPRDANDAQVLADACECGTYYNLVIDSTGRAAVDRASPCPRRQRQAKGPLLWNPSGGMCFAAGFGFNG